MYVVPLTLKHKQKQWGNVPEGGNLKQHGMALGGGVRHFTPKHADLCSVPRIHI